MKKAGQFVLDASVALDWLYHDGDPAYMRKILALIDDETRIHVPPIWLSKIMNGAVMAVRHKKFDRKRIKDFLEALTALPIHFHVPPDWRGALANAFQDIALALDNGLTAHDNSYLITAMQLGLPLATLDKDLRKAARAAGIRDAAA